MFDWIDTRIATMLASVLAGCVLVFSDISDIRFLGALLLVNAGYLFLTRPKNNVLPFRKPPKR